MDDEISYHSSRALAELDQARRSADAHAARRHLELAEQHLERMRSLCRTAGTNPAAAVPSGSLPA
jgi:hypothetical protein